MGWAREEPQMDQRMKAAIEGLLLATQHLRAGDLPDPVVEAVNEVALAYLRLPD